MEFTDNFLCEYCQGLFSTKSNLSKHIRRFHPEKYIRPTCNLFKCLEENCGVDFRYSKYLIEHLQSAHGIHLVSNNLYFGSEVEFENWVADLEKFENVRYFQPRGRRIEKNNIERRYYYCSRSGRQKVVSDSARKINIKSQGLYKTNLGCTSRISCERDVETDRCSVVYVSTHYGHSKDIMDVPNSKTARQRRVKKSKPAVPIARAEGVDQDEDEAPEPLLGNLKVEKDVCVQDSLTINDGCRHADDATSVGLWVEECKSSTEDPVLFFKKKGELFYGYEFKENDFCLILMNATQKDMFVRLARDIVCVDGTRLISLDLELTILLVLDDMGDAFPVAFLFSNRKDSYVYEIFFNVIRESTQLAEYADVFQTNVLMTDKSDTYYDAWCSIIGPVETHLYSSWHIEQAWQKRLRKVHDQEQRRWIQNSLKFLQYLEEMELFENQFHEFLDSLSGHQEVEQFKKYLMTQYYHNRAQWAYSYRKLSELLTNLHLESMHKVVLYICCNGKKIRRLDEIIHILQKYTRDKVIEYKNQLSSHENSDLFEQIERRHASAVVQKCGVVPVEENNYKISDPESNDVYFVTRIRESACCVLKCHHCNICIHTFHCSCIDFSLGQICKHIHSICVQQNDEICAQQNLEEWRNSMKVELEFLKECVESFEFTAEEQSHYLQAVRNLSTPLNLKIEVHSEQDPLEPCTSTATSLQNIIVLAPENNKRRLPKTISSAKIFKAGQKVVTETLPISYVFGNIAHDHAYT